MRGTAALAVLSAALCLAPFEDGPAISAAPVSKSGKGSYVGNEVIVRFNAGVSPAEAWAVLSRHGMTIIKSYKRVTNLYHIRLPSVLTVEDAIEILKAEPEVQYAEPNYTVEFDSACPAPCSPNDPEYLNQWGLANIQAEGAWATTHGSADVVVAVIDSGIDYGHPDLTGNIWINADDPINGVDDDDEGYVDDYYGYNAVTDTCGDNTCLHPAGDPMDDDTSVNGHGTRLAGIIGAVGNNGTGIAGVNWHAKLLPIKIRFEPNRQSSEALVLAGLDYLIAKRTQGVNVKIANMSFGVPSYSQALQDGIDAVRDAGILLIGSAGNGGADGIGDDVDADNTDFHRVYDNVLFVGAIKDQSNILADFSNYGPLGIQLAAPGFGILSTVRSVYDPLYQTDDGTSYSAPFVTGVAALLLAYDPTLTYTQLKARIISATTRATVLSGMVASGGRLNAAGVFTAPITDLTPAGYQPARLEAGHQYYLDRSFTVASIPQGFDGLWWIRTKNDDKTNADTNFIHIGLGQESTVYVAYDPRAVTLPDWLGAGEDWTDTGREVGVTGDPVGTLRIYAKPFGPGSAVLGGNQAAGASGSESNYIVLIRSSAGNSDTTGISELRLDGYDLVRFNLAMGSSDGSANWCAACDLDGSGTIDATDLGLFMDNFGKSL